MITDIHTHRIHANDAIISIPPDFRETDPGKLYSIGLHPWHTEKFSTEMADLIRAEAEKPHIAAIGETGIDKLRGGNIDKQKQVFAFHANLAETLRKPLIIHEVKSADMILSMHKKLKPNQAWIRHGFRGNAAVAKMYANHGIYLSFGEKFNADAVRSIHPGMMLLETDESELRIEDIAANIADTIGIETDEIINICSLNISRILNPMR